jgi:GPI mannosyltransferase 3
MTAPDLSSAVRRIAVLGALALSIAATFSIGPFHADEHFQILEFAGWKLGITPETDLTWEFGARIRPALQPAMVVVVHRLLNAVGVDDPYATSLLLRLFTAALAWYGTVLLFNRRLRDDLALQHRRLRSTYAALAFLLWFGVFAAVRFSSEGLSAAFFLIGFARIAHSKEKSGRHWLFSGLLIGLACVARLHVAFLAVGLLAWCLFIARTAWPKLSALVLGIALAQGLGLLLDRWFYGEWAFTAWNYFEQNIIAGKAASFGTEPWWWYFAQIAERAVPPFSIAFVALPVLAFVFRRRDPAIWAAVPFLLAHLVIGHKELRFLFPLIALLPALVVLGAHAAIERGWLNAFGERWWRALRISFIAVHAPLLLVVLFKPANEDAALREAIYEAATAPMTLVHDGRQPFAQQHPVWFGRPRGLRFALREEGWPNEAAFLLLTMDQSPALTIGFSAHERFASYPAWARRFNIGGWADRTDRWVLFEVRRDG